MAKERYSDTLITEAEKIGYTVTDLDKYYNKGLIAWTENKIPGVTPEQLGLAVVEEFVDSEKKRKFTIREEELVEEKPIPKIMWRGHGVAPLTPPKIVVCRDDVIQAWLVESRPKYIKRYGDKAEQKLSEAMEFFHASKPVIEEAKWTPPEEPAHANKPGTKRHSWDMAHWHNHKRAEAEKGGNSEAVEYHASKITEYRKKIMHPSGYKE